MGREDQGIEQSRERYRVIPRVLCFVTHGDKVLLILGGPHKRLWAGRYNGLGGHVEAGEDIYAAVLREVEEEAGLEVHQVRLCAVVHADAGDPAVGILFFVFTAVAADLHVRPSAEGELAWVPIGQLPADRLVEDLPVLLPKVLDMAPGDPPLFAMYAYDARNRLVIRFAGPQ